MKVIVEGVAIVWLLLAAMWSKEGRARGKERSCCCRKGGSANSLLILAPLVGVAKTAACENHVITIHLLATDD